jgi:hypothetical protein
MIKAPVYGNFGVYAKGNKNSLDDYCAPLDNPGGMHHSDNKDAAKLHPGRADRRRRPSVPTFESAALTNSSKAQYISYT